MDRKVLVVALDSATFDVLCPLIDEGWMPNLEELINQGASGPLESTIPPLTAPAWVALATGMNPERTGIVDFLYREDHTYHLRSLDSSAYRGTSVWDHLSLAGKRVGIFNYPMLRPPYEVNGFMTGGVGSCPKEDFSFPAALKPELFDALGTEYEMDIPYAHPRYDDTDLFLNDLSEMFEKQIRAAEYLLTKKEWDLFWAVFSQTDWLQHLMWRHLDETHPLHEGRDSAPYAHAFRQFWGKVDDVVGRFHRISGDDTNILVLSDHGAGPSDQQFKLNAWLEREGYLVRKTQHTKASLHSALGAVARSLGLSKMTPALHERAAGRLRVSLIDEIDLARSIAFDPGHTIPFGGIYVNANLVKTHSERRETASEIGSSLTRWGREHGIAIATWVMTSGADAQRHAVPPDLLIGVNDWRCLIVKDQFEGSLFDERPFSAKHTASHRMNGILVAAGPDVQKVNIAGAHVCDVAPTLLHMFGQPIPDPVDGRVLEEIFSEEFLKSSGPREDSEHRTGSDPCGGQRHS